MTENEAIDLDKLIEDAKVLAKEKDTLARTFRNFKDYGNPKSTITSGAEKAQKEAEQYKHISKLFEELKAYRDNDGMSENVYKAGFKFGYNTAIDDFTTDICNLIEDLSVIKIQDVDEIAEQLKAGGADVNNE